MHDDGRLAALRQVRTVQRTAQQTAVRSGAASRPGTTLSY